MTRTWECDSCGGRGGVESLTVEEGKQASWYAPPPEGGGAGTYRPRVRGATKIGVEKIKSNFSRPLGGPKGAGVTPPRAGGSELKKKKHGCKVPKNAKPFTKKIIVVAFQS